MCRSSLPKNSSRTFLVRVADMLGLPSVRGHVSLVVALAVSAVGAGLSGPLLLLYMTTVVGMPLVTAGAVLTATGIVALAVPALTAILSAKLGARIIVVAAQLVQGLGLLGLLTASSPVGRAVPVLAICCLLISIGQRAFWSSVFALVAKAADGSEATDQPTAHRARSARDAWFALAGMLQGVGFAVGAMSAGALLLLSGMLPYLVTLILSASSFIASAALIARVPGRPRTMSLSSESSSRPLARVFPDRTYLLLIAANTFFAFCSVILGVGLPLYVSQGLDAPLWLIGPLLALNSVLGATCQGLAVRATARFRRVRVLLVAGLLWAGWGVAMASLDLAPLWVVVPGLFATVTIYSIAELIHAPLSIALASDAAPEASRAAYLSWFQYSFALATVAAPGIFALTFAVTPTLPWLITSVIAAAGCLLLAVVGRRLPA